MRRSGYRRHSLRGFRVVVTRAESDSGALVRLLRSRGVRAYVLPCIRFVPVVPSPRVRKALRQLDQYQWVIFTSSRGVLFFLKLLERFGVPRVDLCATSVAAIGPSTSYVLRKAGIPVSFVPSHFESIRMAKDIMIKRGARVLLPRSRIAPSTFSRLLRSRGAAVTVAPIYTTTLISARDLRFERLVTQGRIDCTVFMSPSAVRGLRSRVHRKEVWARVLDMPAAAVGPLTAKALRVEGFRRVIVARRHTPAGILSAITSLAYPRKNLKKTSG